MTIRAHVLYRLSVLVPAIAICISFASVVAAQTVASDSPDSEENRRMAFEAFKEGTALYDDGRHIAASEAFRRANRFSYNWKILYNIGQCEAAAKRYGMALEAFEEYLARAGDEIHVERRDEVIAEVSRLRQMVGILEVKAPEGAKIEVDGIDRGTVPLTGPVMLSAGVAHQLVVILDGDILLQQAIKLTGGQEKLVQTGPLAVNDAGTDTGSGQQEMSSHDTKSRGLKVAGWLMLGTGTALAVGGLVVGGVGFSQANALSDEHDGQIPPEKKGEVTRLNNMSLMADIFIGAGAGVALAGVVLLVVHKRKNAASDKVALSPVLCPEFAGAMLMGRF